MSHRKSRPGFIRLCLVDTISATSLIILFLGILALINALLEPIPAPTQVSTYLSIPAVKS